MRPALRFLLLLAQRIASWLPTALFSSGAPGAWWDAGDLTDDKLAYGATHTNAEFLAQYPNHALFQDSAGTLAVKALGDPVGKVLDKSGRGNHLIQPTAGARPTWGRRVNILNATATLATQSVTTIAAQYRLSFTGAGSIALSGTGSGTITAGSTLVTCTAGTLTLTVTGSVTLADMRLVADVATPAYQAVVSATNYDYSGFPSKITHNGASQFLYTASTMNLTSTDKVTVFAGVTKLSDAVTFGVVVETGNRISVQAGSFTLHVPASAGEYNITIEGTSSASYSLSTFTAPITNVISFLGNIAGSGIANELFPRVNGAVPTKSILSGRNDAGTGNYGNYTTYVGARAGASLWLNGSWSEQIIVGKLCTDTEIRNAENFVNTSLGRIY